MSGGGDKRRKRGLSDDDEALWGYVTRNVAPESGKPRVLERETREEDWPPPGAEPAKRPPAVRSKPVKQTSIRQPPAIRKPPPLPAAPIVLERRKARRIARGTEEIEARIDLHGMTQDDAHFALIGFVRRCRASGLRTVLVITGKGGAGGSRSDDEVIPRPRGVLRRNVPRWLGGPEIGALVISYSQAHVRHGGEGALYVRLRRLA